LGTEYTGYAGQFLVNHIGCPMRRGTHRAAAGRHTVAKQLLPPEHVKQLKLNAVNVVAGLRNSTDNEGFHTEYRPVGEVHVDAAGGTLQHFLGIDRRETPAALQVGRDYSRDVKRRGSTIAFPSERYY